MYLSWKANTPLKARSAGKGALIGVIVSVALVIVATIVAAVVFGSLGSTFGQ